MEHLHGRSECDHEKITTLRQLAGEVVHAALHVRQDVDHTAAGVHQNPDTGINPIFFKNLDVLEVIVFVNPKIVFRETRDKVTLLVFYSCEDVNEINVNFQVLRKIDGDCSSEKEHCEK